MSIEDNPEKDADSIKSGDSSNSPTSGQPVNDTSSRYNIFHKIQSNRFLSRRTLVWMKRGLIPLLGLLVALGIIFGVVYFYRCNPDIFERLETYGYLGVFLISILFNATIIFPLSNISVIISMGATLGVPLFVGLAGGSGAAIGELTGYLAGRSGQGFFRKSKLYLRLEGWVKRWGWIAIFIMSVFPAVFDIVGLIAGALRMPLWKFFLACAGGRIISYTVVAYTADLGFKFIPWFD
jgi:membrane protein DedA with SNARE-associated domain